MDIVCATPVSKEWNTPQAVVDVDTGIYINCSVATKTWIKYKATVEGVSTGDSIKRDIITPIFVPIITLLLGLQIDAGLPNDVTSLISESDYLVDTATMAYLIES